MNMMAIDVSAKSELGELEAPPDTLEAERAFFSSLTNLLQYRQGFGLKKKRLANRFGTDAGTVTRLTTRPTNLKISTIARLAYALEARAMLVFVANENADMIFTPDGIRSAGAVQSDIENTPPRMNRSPLGRYDAWIEQPDDQVDG